MAATIRLDYFGGNASEPAGVTAESGFKFNKADSISGTTPIVKPASTGTAFSFVKQLGFNVTASDSTNLSAFKISRDKALRTGLTLGFLGHATYLDQTGGTGAGADSGSNGAVPSGYTAVTTTAQQWYAGPISAGTTGRKGDFCRLVLGVDNTYAAGASSALALASDGTALTINADYTEA